MALATIGAMQPWCPAAEPTVEPASASFTTVLSNADLLNAAGTQQALRELGLLAVPDILRLDAAESTEMVSLLREVSVTLGDRSRLRELVDSHRVRPAQLSDPAASTDGSQAAAPRPAARALQEAKTESSLSISGCVSALSCHAGNRNRNAA